MIDSTKLEHAFKEILEALGDDPKREGLIDTPKRAASMWAELMEGMNYTNDEIASMFDTTFKEDSDNGVVVVKGIEIFSFCEHHLALMYDMSVDVAYIPKGRVIGLSKISRICDMVSKRLQLQERITKDILYIIKKITKSDDIYVRVRGVHSCVSARGIKKKTETLTETKVGNIEGSVFR